MFNEIILLCLLILFYLIYVNYQNIKINFMVFLIISRGILAPNCSWWSISDYLLKDKSGVELFYDLKNKYGDFIPIDMIGREIYVVTNKKYIKTILDNSPNTFNVGKLKYQIFKSFMPNNLGVSSGKEWIQRRLLNEYVLDTNRLHQYAYKFNLDIRDILYQHPIPLNFDQFTHISKLITMKIIFNRSKIEEPLFNIFKDANSYRALLIKDYKINPKIMCPYMNYLLSNIKHPSCPSLVCTSTQFTDNTYELIQQIPHWIFPIVSLTNTSIPRLLLILCNHPHIFNKLLFNIKNIDPDNAEQIYNCQYLRSCVLELLRLNNPVVTTFRTLMCDYRFDDQYSFPKDTQFLILNNPVLRDPITFPHPNQYIPERWSTELEQSYSTLMFNQGPQQCPAKELAIFILQSVLVWYLYKSNIVIKGIKCFHCKKQDMTYVEQMINPCVIKFSID